MGKTKYQELETVDICKCPDGGVDFISWRYIGGLRVHDEESRSGKEVVCW